VKLPAGSPLWLLRHELKLQFRAAGSRLWILLAIAAVLWVPLHLFAWTALKGLDLVALPESVTLIFGSIVLLAISLMLAHGIAASVEALFARGDLDLLLASPIEPRTVFLVRSLAIAFGSILLYLYLASPFAIVGLLSGDHPRLVAIYPALAALGLLITAIAMSVTLALVRWFGARRARIVAQVLGSLVGAAFFLLTQVQTLLGADASRRFSMYAQHWFAPGGLLEPSSVVWLPLRALTGDIASLAVLTVVGVGAFWLMVDLACRRFLEGTQASVTGGAARRSRTARGPSRFRSGLMRIVLVKEWTMIRRDPNLIAKTLLQTLYLLPAAFLMFRHDRSQVLIAAACIVVATPLAGNLAWITVAAEDAPELVGSAPVDLTFVRWAKVFAAMIPIWVLLAPVLVLLLVTSPLVALVFAVCIVGATLSAGVVQIWYPQRGKRSDLGQRGKSGGRLPILLENITGLGWAGITWALLTIPAVALLAIPFAFSGPVVAWLAGRNRREEDGFV
jgi:ABC-2 type transport system permease protein